MGTMRYFVTVLVAHSSITGGFNPLISFMNFVCCYKYTIDTIERYIGTKQRKKNAEIHVNFGEKHKFKLYQMF